MTRLLPLVILITMIGCGDDDDDDVVVADAGIDAGELAIDAGADAGEPAGCRGTADCDNGLGCYGPNDPACGIGPMRECALDVDCGEVLRCHTIVDSCSADGFGSECAPPCSENSCGEGLTCDEGNCRPQLCIEDKSCAPSQRCDPKSVDPSAPAHEITAGCVTIDCKDDEPCPGETVCVNGYCQDGLGTCLAPPP